MTRASLATVAVAVMMTLAAPASRAADVRVELTLAGSTVVAWDAFDEVGNAFGGGVLADVDNISVGLMGAVILPDGRLQGQFGALWVEGRWHFLGRDLLVSPYATLGLGVAFGDSPPAGPVTSFARWAQDGPHPLAMLGAGLRYGQARGMSIAFEARAWNHTHGGLSLVAGYTF